MSRLFGAANWAMYVAFLLSILVQYNDPDPFEWMGIYSVAALVSVLFAARRLRASFAFVVALVAFGWGLLLTAAAVNSPQPISFAAVFGSVGMMNERVELAREAGGLGIVAAWCSVLLWRLRLHRRLRQERETGRYPRPCR